MILYLFWCIYYIDASMIIFVYLCFYVYIHAMDPATSFSEGQMNIM